MLSNSAFNAMLKTLEEPPEHVKFILATTDPQKIPVTVLSRCLQFNLKQMTLPLIATHLAKILAAESIEAEPAALNLIARSAAGSMRDALSLLDQAIAHGAGKVEEAQVRDMLGTVDLDYLFTILEALLNDDAAGMLRVAADMAARSLSFSAALQELASLMTRLQVAQFAPQAVAEDLPERARLTELAGRLDPEYVQLAYQIAVAGRTDLHLAPDELDGFTMTLLRLFAFRPAGEEEGGEEKKPQGSPPEARVSLAGESAAKPKAAVPEPAGGLPDWRALLAALNLSGMARELGQHCALKSLDERRVALCLSPAHRHLQMKAAQEKLREALAEHFGRPVLLSIDVEEISGETPAAMARKRSEKLQEQAAASVEQDAFVREAIELFDATVIESSIKPVLD
jgi:DNA polymerase-3 subunit gamma/tau